MRTVEFEYRVLRGDALYGFLQAPADGAPTIRMEDSAEIKTALSGTFSPVVTDADGNVLEPNWLADEIQPVMIVDGVAHSLGVFSPSQVEPSERNGVQSMRVEAFDRCWRIRDNYTTELLHIAAGENYITRIQTLLIACGIPVILATPTSEVFQEAREDWDIGTSYLAIVNELLGEINYNPVWFNREGQAVLEPASVPLAENIEHTLSDLPDDVLDGAAEIIRMLPSISRRTDIYQAPNVFFCICSNPDKSGPLTSRAENRNPQSPLSIQRRGREIVKVVKVNNIASQNALDLYAERICNESMISGETIQVATAIQPEFGVADVVALKYGDLVSLCIERAWTMELRVGGTMTHTLERVVYNFET